VLDPLWYTGAFLLGAGAGLAGDRWSLGFVSETEAQVINHLEDHLGRLPPGDQRSRAIIEQMKTTRRITAPRRARPADCRCRRRRVA
jgi:3-demethoxyubiquinol 3-hydroxylase